jgi:hypothetical protein
MFEDPNFYEVFRTLNFTMHVIAIREDARFAAPVIFFEGDMEGHMAKMEGSAFLMEDGNVHWSFVRHVFGVTMSTDMICRFRARQGTLFGGEYYGLRFETISYQDYSSPALKVSQPAMHMLLGA